MKTVFKNFLLSCAIASSTCAAIDTRFVAGWPPASANLGSAARLIGENALPMTHNSTHSLDISTAGSWWVDGEQHDKSLGLDISYSYDLGGGFFAGLDGSITGSVYNFVRHNDKGEVVSQRSGRSLNFGFGEAFYAGYFTTFGKLSLTNMALVKGVSEEGSRQPASLGLAWAGEGSYDLLENESGSLSWSGVWYYQYALPSTGTLGRYHDWKLSRGHLVDVATGPVWSAKNWFGGLSYGLTALNLGADSEVTVNQERKKTEQSKRGPFTEKVATNYNTNTVILHKAVAHAGIRSEHAALTMWGSLPLGGEKAVGTPTVGVTVSYNF